MVLFTLFFGKTLPDRTVSLPFKLAACVATLRSCKKFGLFCSVPKKGLIEKHIPDSKI